MQNFEKWKKNLEIWWIATFPQNLALIRFMVSEKTGVTDDGRTTDVRASALALLTLSSRVKRTSKKKENGTDKSNGYLLFETTRCMIERFCKEEIHRSGIMRSINGFLKCFQCPCLKWPAIRYLMYNRKCFIELSSINETTIHVHVFRWPENNKLSVWLEIHF